MSMMPSMHGATRQWKMSSPFRKVLVESVSDYVSSVRDLGSGSSYDVQNTTPNGLLPEPGDVWLITNDAGPWQFSRMIDADVPVASTQRDMASILERRRLFERLPFDNPVGSVAEAPVGAYIGERRLLEARPDSRWLVEDGSAVGRYRYPALFDLIGERYGPGDGVETFNLPNQYDSSGDFALVQSSPLTIGSGDFTVTTTLTQITGFAYSFTVPAWANPSEWFVEVEATIVQDFTNSGGSTTSEVVLRLDGSTYLTGGQTHSIEFLNTANGRYWGSQVWKVFPGSTGNHVVDLSVSKAGSVATIYLVRKNCSMYCKVYRGGGTVASSSPAQWHILAE